MAPQSLGLATPVKKYPRIGQVTPGQGGLAVDPRMAAAGAYAQANGITQPNYGPPANQGYQLQVNPNQPPAWGPAGAPADFHQWRAAEVAAGRNPATGQPQPLGLAAPAPPVAPPAGAAVVPAFRDFRVAPEGTIQGPNAAISNRIAPTSAPSSLFGSNVEADIAKARGIARQGNYRESMLADINGVSRGMPKPQPEKNYRNMSAADRERIAARFPGGKFLPYGSEPNGAAGAMTKADAEQIDASKVAKAQLGLAIDRRHNGFEPSPGGMSPQEKYDMRQFDKRNAARQLTADRASGKAQTPRQVRMLARAAAQKEQFEQGLGLVSPGAYAQLQGSKAQIAAAKEAGASRDKLLRDELAAKERMNSANNTSAETRAKTAAGAAAQKAGIDPTTGAPLDTRTPEQKIAAAPDPTDLHLLPPKERAARVANLPPETQKRILAEANTPTMQERVVNSPFGDLSAAVAPWIPGPHQYSSLFGFGYKAPPPARPARRGKRIGSYGVSGSY